MVTPPENYPSPYVIQSNNESISSETSLLIVAEIQPLPLSPKEEPTTEHRDEKLQKKSAEPFCTCTLNIVHHDSFNILYVPP